MGITGLITTSLYESINFLHTTSITKIAIIGGLSSALIGNTIFYIRKLYKFCINDRFEPPNGERERFNQLGISLYFLARPLFAIAFSSLIHIILKSGVNF